MQRMIEKHTATPRSTTSSECLSVSEGQSGTVSFDRQGHNSAIVRTLNANYAKQPYGLGHANTTYPASAFITDLVYLKGSKVHVNVGAITVSSVGYYVVMHEALDGACDHF